MPIFKFSTPANAGEILLRAYLDGEGGGESFGNIILIGLVGVSGQQVVVVGHGDIDVNIALGGQSTDAAGDGDITLHASIMGYSTGAQANVGRGSIILYDFERLLISGDGILNGIGNGSLIVRARELVTVEGRQGARGGVTIGVTVGGFGTRRAMGGDIAASAVVDGYGIKENVFRYEGRAQLLRMPVTVNGFGSVVAVVSRTGEGGIITPQVSIVGYGAVPIYESDDAVLRYESRRRHI